MQSSDSAANTVSAHCVPNVPNNAGVNSGNTAAIVERRRTQAAIALAQYIVYVSMRYAVIEVKIQTIPSPNGMPAKIGTIQ